MHLSYAQSRIPVYLARSKDISGFEENQIINSDGLLDYSQHWMLLTPSQGVSIFPLLLWWCGVSLPLSQTRELGFVLLANPTRE
jgi:hypothetical protein